VDVKCDLSPIAVVGSVNCSTFYDALIRCSANKTVELFFFSDTMLMSDGGDLLESISSDDVDTGRPHGIR
jgi:hypothetical protein